MVQQPRREEPLYSCTVPVEPLTGQVEEEVVAFGLSEAAAKEQAEILLATSYNCNNAQIRQLMQQAEVSALSPWCASEQSRARGAGGAGGAGGDNLV